MPFISCASIDNSGTVFGRPLGVTHRLVLITLVLGLILWWDSMDAWALEKYGRPLPSMEEGKDTEHEPGETHESEPEASWVHGYLLTASFVRNPTFTARPDNTGLVGLRHMVHLETDLYKQYLTFYTDQNVLSDRTNGWIKLSEWDMTYALTGLLGHVGWRVQYERDAPLDRSGLKQIYGDTLITYRFQAQEWSWWQRVLPAQNITRYRPGWTQGPCGLRGVFRYSAAML
jgi:hypothetical protein